MNCKPPEDRYFHPRAAKEARRRKLLNAAGKATGLAWLRAWIIILWAKFKKKLLKR